MMVRIDIDGGLYMYNVLYLRYMYLWYSSLEPMLEPALFGHLRFRRSRAAPAWTMMCLPSQSLQTAPRITPTSTSSS